MKVESYEIHVSFQPEKAFLHARAGVTLRAGQRLEAIEFELNPNLKILEVTDAGGNKLTFARSQRLGSPKLSVRLAAPSEHGQEVRLAFLYEGALPEKLLDYISKDGILLRDESRWYPAVDLSAFTQNDLAISVPPTLEAMTSGELIEHRTSNTASTFRWKTSRPVSSRSLVAYPRREGTIGAGAAAPSEAGIAVQEICPSPSASEPAISCGKISAIVQDLLGWYDRHYGPYPSRKMTVVPGFPGVRGAIGYSAPGFLVVSEDVVKYHDYPGYAPEFLPHEIAHQWFPIEVTLASEADGWLAEGLAEYLAWRYLQEKDPAAARRMVARAMRDALAMEPLRPLALGLRLFALEDEEVTHATLYQRGMLAFGTLETVIDRERVDRALREYYRRYAGKAASIANFRTICEETSGRDLGWFFDYFIQGTRIPEIEIRRTSAAAPGEAAGDIVLRNVPTQFQVRVEMRLETAAGPVDHSVATRGEVTPFTVTTAQPATRLALDPDQRLLRWTEAARRYRSQHALLAQVGEFERAGELERAARNCAQALAADPENLASNEQQVRFALGRLRYRQGQLAAAFAEFGKVLELPALDPMERDFNRAWSRVYRARVEKRRGRLAAARAEAQVGLGMKSPALETPVIFPQEPERATTAAAELHRLAQ